MVDKIGVKINLDIVERVAWGDKVRIQNDFRDGDPPERRRGGPDERPARHLGGGRQLGVYTARSVPGLLDTLHQADASYDDKRGRGCSSRRRT